MGLVYDWKIGLGLAEWRRLAEWIGAGMRLSENGLSESSSVETLRSVPIEFLFPVPLRDCLLGLTFNWHDLLSMRANPLPMGADPVLIIGTDRCVEG